MRRLRWLLVVGLPMFVLSMYASIYSSFYSRMARAYLSESHLEQRLEDITPTRQPVKVEQRRGGIDEIPQSSLYDCVSGRARRVDRLESLTVDKDWTGDVVVQVDNRLPSFENASAWEVKGHVESSLLFNSLVAERYEAKYILIRVPKSCVTPHNETVIRFWCKVPAIRLTAKRFPSARSVLFLDSDAYLNAAVSVGQGLWSNRYAFHESSPLYVGRSTRMQWEVLNEKMNLYHEPMNSGAILFHPRSVRVRETLDWWWINATSPGYVSLVDACKSRIIVRFNFDPRCPVQANVRRIGRVRMFQRIQLLLSPLLHPLTKGRPIGQLFAPRPTLVREVIDLESRGLKFRPVRSMHRPRMQVEFRIGHLRDVDEIDRVLRALQVPKSMLTQRMEEIFGCPILERKVWVMRPSSMLKQWPGDQERLQSIRERFPQHVKVRTDLATYDAPSLRLNSSLVFHSCKRVMRGQRLALSYLMQQGQTEQHGLGHLVERLKAIETVCMAPGSTPEF